MNVVAVGDAAFVTAFGFLGAKGIVVEKKDLRDILKKLINDDTTKLIILSEKYADFTADIRLDILKKGKFCPIFAVVPDIRGEGRGSRLKEIKSYVTMTIGVEIK